MKKIMSTFLLTSIVFFSSTKDSIGQSNSFKIKFKNNGITYKIFLNQKKNYESGTGLTTFSGYLVNNYGKKFNFTECSKSDVYEIQHTMGGNFDCLCATFQNINGFAHYQLREGNTCWELSLDNETNETSYERIEVNTGKAVNRKTRKIQAEFYILK